MTVAQLLKIHAEIEQANKQRIAQYLQRRKRIADTLTSDREAFRQYIKQHSA